jgi:sugar lactone lactonase YvrE
LAALGQTSYPYVITTVAGTYPVGDGGPATQAMLLSPNAVALDSAGNVYIADTSNGRVRKVSLGGVIGTVPGTENTYPQGLAVDATGNLYTASSYYVLKVTPSGEVIRVAGSGEYGFGGDGGPALAAQFAGIAAVAVDSAGSLYIADASSHRVRKVDAAGTITTVAGSGTRGYRGDNGPAKDAWLNYPSGVAVDPTGNVYIGDRSNARVRKVTPAGVITTVAGTGTWGFAGDGGFATGALLNYPCGLAVDNQGNLYIADRSNQRVRKVTAAGVISTVAGNGSYGYGGDGGLATSAALARIFHAPPSKKPLTLA